MIKKTLSFMIFSFLAVTLVSIFCSAEDFPKIINAEGSVFVNLTGQEWVAAETGTIITEGSLIRTSDASYCDISLDNSKKNVISIGPNSEIKVGEYLKRLQVLSGRVFAQLRQLEPGSTFEVATPQAIAGVRGTQWETIVEKGATFNVSENTIYVKGLDEAGNLTQSKNVPQGQTLSVDEAGWLGELAALTDQDKERLENWSKKINELLSLSSGDKKRCLELVDNYQGAQTNLFEQVLSCEAAQGGEAFASAEGADGLLVGREDANQDLGDITNNYFKPEIETPIEPSEPPQEPKVPAGPPPG